MADQTRLTQVGRYVVTLGPLVHKPSIVSADPTSTGVLLTGSTFVSIADPVRQLQKATWRVYGDAAGTELVYELEVDYGVDFPTDPDHFASGLAPDTDCWASVQYEDTEGGISAESDLFAFATLAANAPDAPTITLVDEISEDSARFTLSAYSHVDDDGAEEPQPWSHAASRLQIDVQSGDFSSPLLDVEWFEGEGYGLLVYWTQGIFDPATVLKARAAVQDARGSYSAWSASKQFQTLDGSTTRPATPTVTIDDTGEDSVTAHTGAFSAGDGGAHDATRWVITADAAGETVISDELVDSGDLINYTRTGLPASAGYVWAYHREDNGLWSARSDAAAFGFTGTGMWFPIFKSPLDAHLMSGEAYTVEFESQNDDLLPAGAHWELEISTDMGVNWTTLDDSNTSGTYSLDTTAYSDGVVLLRVRMADDVEEVGTTWTTVATGIKNDAPWDLEITNDTMQADGGIADFDGQYWHDSNHGMFGPFDPDYGLARQNGYSGNTDMMVLRRTADRILRQGSVMGRIMLDGPPRAGFSWQHGYWQEELFGGVGLGIQGKESLGETLRGITVSFYMVPVLLGPVVGGPANTGDGRIRIDLREEDGTHWIRQTPRIGPFHGKLIEAAGIWYGVGGVYDEFPDREPWYGMIVDETRTSNADGTEDVRIRVRMTGAWAHYLDGQLDANGWHMDETFTSVVMACGHPGFCGRQVKNRADGFNGWAWTEALAMQVTDEDDCVDCPDPPDCTGTPNANGGATVTATPLA